jgi:hypothetical protein
MAGLFIAWVLGEVAIAVLSTSIATMKLEGEVLVVRPMLEQELQEKEAIAKYEAFVEASASVMLENHRKELELIAIAERIDQQHFTGCRVYSNNTAEPGPCVDKLTPEAADELNALNSAIADLCRSEANAFKLENERLYADLLRTQIPVQTNTVRTIEKIVSPVVVVAMLSIAKFALFYRLWFDPQPIGRYLAVPVLLFSFTYPDVLLYLSLIPLTFAASSTCLFFYYLPGEVRNGLSVIVRSIFGP